MPDDKVSEVEQPESDPFKGVTAKVEDQVRLRSDFRSIYANSVAIGTSPWDMWIVFGEITGRKVDGKPVIEETIKVSMTREVVKVFAHILANSIAAYEKLNGEIKVPNVEIVNAAEPTVESSPEAKE